MPDVAEKHVLVDEPFDRRAISSGRACTRARSDGSAHRTDRCTGTGQRQLAIALRERFLLQTDDRRYGLINGQLEAVKSVEDSRIVLTDRRIQPAGSPTAAPSLPAARNAGLSMAASSIFTFPGFCTSHVKTSKATLAAAVRVSTPMLSLVRIRSKLEIPRECQSPERHEISPNTRGLHPLFFAI